jgi:putative N6-adenine-specific DNA methylase
LARSEAVRVAWDRLVAAARADILPQAPAPIVCAERFAAAVETARQNAAAAGVARDLTFDVADVRDSKPQWPAGNLVTNPPYGERLMGDPAGPSPSAYRQGGSPAAAYAPQTNTPSSAPPPALRPDGQPAWQPAERDAHVQQLKLAGLYRGMSEAFERFQGWGIVILSGNPMWAQEMRRRPQISHRLFNGALEVRLLRYDVPAGGGGLPPPSSSDRGRSGGGGGGRRGGAERGGPRRR